MIEDGVIEPRVPVVEKMMKDIHDGKIVIEKWKLSIGYESAHDVFCGGICHWSSQQRLSAVEIEESGPDEQQNQIAANESS